MTKNYDEAMLDFVANQDEINRRLKQLKITLAQLKIACAALESISFGLSGDGASGVARIALERIKLMQKGDKG